MTVGGNLIVNGTLTSINVTSVNIIDTNISSGTLSITSLASLVNRTTKFANHLNNNNDLRI